MGRVDAFSCGLEAAECPSKNKIRSDPIYIVFVGIFLGVLRIYGAFVFF
jgi:hypothetical protein